jgi:hypothetical protein
MSRYPLQRVEDRRDNVMWQECRRMVDEICESQKVHAIDVWNHHYDFLGDPRPRGAKTMSESQLQALHASLREAIRLNLSMRLPSLKTKFVDKGVKWAEFQRRAHEVNPVLWDVLWDRHCSLKSLGKRYRRSLDEVLEAIEIDLSYEEREKIARTNRMLFERYASLPD